MNDIELPPLPDADVTNNTNLLGYRYSYSAISMQSYARSAVEADRAQRVPEGWKLVPVEPTEEMLCSGDDVLREAFRDRCIATRTIYDAMLASTPAPAQQEPSEAEMVCAEAYQVVGCLLSDLGLFETEAARKILDNLSEARMVHQDVLPWESAAQHQEPPQQERKPKRHSCDDPLCAVCGHHGIKE